MSNCINGQDPSTSMRYAQGDKTKIGMTKKERG